MMPRYRGSHQMRSQRHRWPLLQGVIRIQYGQVPTSNAHTVEAKEATGVEGVSPSSKEQTDARPNAIEDGPDHPQSGTRGGC